MTQPYNKSEDRVATPQEIERDSLTLARMRNMFPSTAEIQMMAADNICESIPQWQPFIEQAITHCVTDDGAEAFRRLGEFLSEIKELGPCDTTRDATDRAFFRLIRISQELRDQAREIAAST